MASSTPIAKRKPKKKRRPKKKSDVVCTTRKTRVKGRVVKKKVCHRRRRTKTKVVIRQPGPSAASPPVTTPLAGPLPQPPVNPAAAPDPLVYAGAFGAPQAERLLWRAGFGPRPGEAGALAAKGLEAAITSLTRPSGAAQLTGPQPSAGGLPLAPQDQYDHDHLFWLDRMVRSDQPLVERMALVWHDWFATRRDDVGQIDLCLNQIDLFRTHGLGSFRDLLIEVTRDPAMLLMLSGANSDKNHPNENYGREVMELFTLGADRGAYTEFDVREAARALTGFRADYVTNVGWANFRYDAASHDTKPKTIFGKTGNYDWRDLVDLCLRNAYHRSFFVLKLWSYFVPSPPDATTQAALEKLYVDSDWSIRAVLEAILRHPALHTGGALVKPPVVFSAGIIRARGQSVDDTALAESCAGAGQKLFAPPNVAGWNDRAWLDTSTLYHRWRLVYHALEDDYLKSDNTYSATETPQQAVDAALAFWGGPAISDATRQALLAMATSAIPANLTGTNIRNRRAQRQNALRHLLMATPDLQAS